MKPISIENQKNLHLTFCYIENLRTAAQSGDTLHCTRQDYQLYLCHLPRGTSDLLEGQSGVSRALFHPKLPLNQF